MWTDSGTFCEGVVCRREKARRPCVGPKVAPHFGVGRGILRIRRRDTLRYLGISKQLLRDERREKLGWKLGVASSKSLERGSEKKE